MPAKKKSTQKPEDTEVPVPPPSEKEKHGSLVAALHAAQWQAKRIDKDSKNTFSNYDYTSAESMMQMWTEISGEHGLALFPLELNIRYTPGDPPTLQTTWLLSHLGGEDRTLTMEWPVVTGKGKPLDKAIASARTSSLGYLIRDLLIAPRVNPTDDMDHTKWSQGEDKKRSYNRPKRTQEDNIREFWQAVKSFGYVRETVESYCQMRGAKMPHDMNQSEHTRMLEWLMSPKGREAIKNYKDSK
tara:strand:- start:18681 stop:19409 length:729 start_codon:yes stop_codon:yes gene_type:complete